MPTERDDARILHLLEDQAAAIRRKDAQATLAPYAADLVSYDLAPPLATTGEEARDKVSLEAWFATWSGPIEIDLAETVVTVGGDLAFCHGFVRIGGTKTDGARTSVWARQTVCLRRRDDDWQIVHQHVSVPFLMDGSGLAALHLEP